MTATSLRALKVALSNISSKPKPEPDPPYVPGQRIPSSGIYQVWHESHRKPHEVTMVQGAFFPFCRVCGNGVRFVRLRIADRLREDYDFSYAFRAAGARAAG